MYTPGTLVRLRERDWVVQPSDNQDLLLLQPLGGSEDEQTGIYLPLAIKSDTPKPSQFPLPSAADLGNLHSARMLHDATRLSFRNGAGPFRSLAKLSFRPRAYQMVPLVMALRQERVRLLIADDVGIGKTIEALLVLREMLERRKIRRFAVICLPHLCEQWQEEIRDKLDIEAVIIRSSTQARLDREIQGDASVYQHYSFQIISIDYIKQESRCRTFVSQCPELVIVDEAHACACPAGATVNQQQRHALLSEIAAKPDQHLIMLTATPHSGKPEEFQSLLGLLNPEFRAIDLSERVPDKIRREIARHFIQRRRADVMQWASEKTTFAQRSSQEVSYTFSQQQESIFERILAFARSLTENQALSHQSRVSYWTALALLRGVVSSPAAGAAMLRARLDRLGGDDLMGDIAEEADPADAVLDADPTYGDGAEVDTSPIEIMHNTRWSDTQRRRLNELASELEKVATPTRDLKISAAAKIIVENLRDGFNTVVFCRYIATAHYVGEHLALQLKKSHPKAVIEVVTSEDPDEVRRSRIESMADAAQRILVATDCLSEGVNLHAIFTAVLHYDLPWNPNRIEQREGRVDRFGQTSSEVRTHLLYGKNPVDGIVLDVIINKIRNIRRATGITIAFPAESKSLMESIAQAVLLSPNREIKESPDQMLLELPESEEEVANLRLQVEHQIEAAEKREKLSRTIFAQHAIKADELEKDLREADEFIGNPDAVNCFVEMAMALFGAEFARTSAGYRLYTTNLPEVLKSFLPPESQLKVSFESPTPRGYLYLGRNHPFVEHLCHYVMRHSLEHNHQQGASRAAVIRSNCVNERHVIYLCRCRNVIERPADQSRIIAEEMLLWGYSGYHGDCNYLDHNAARNLLETVRATANMTKEAMAATLENEIQQVYPALTKHAESIALERSNRLVEAHLRFSKLLNERERYKPVVPVLPMDVMGIYLILPDTASG